VPAESRLQPERLAPLVQFEDVHFRVGTVEILRGVSFDVLAGETLVLLGRSGSGKTTALKMVNALLTPAAGRVLVEGRATTEWNPFELRRRIGYVIQETGLFPHFTVAQNVAMVPRLMGWEEARIGRRVEEMLERVGLAPREYASRFPRELSGGQRQRVGVARALAADPPLLLFDEPFGALDPVTRHEVRREFQGLARDLGKTAIFVTHDVREALGLANRIGLLAGGRLEELLPVSGFLAAQSAEARAFLECLRDD
jgi:osmoprotectant transport system ATP-binding protein